MTFLFSDASLIFLLKASLFGKHLRSIALACVMPSVHKHLLPVAREKGHVIEAGRAELPYVRPG